MPRCTVGGLTQPNGHGFGVKGSGVCKKEEGEGSSCGGVVECCWWWMMKKMVSEKLQRHGYGEGGGSVYGCEVNNVWL